MQEKSKQFRLKSFYTLHCQRYIATLQGIANNDGVAKARDCSHPYLYSACLLCHFSNMIEVLCVSRLFGPGLCRVSGQKKVAAEPPAQVTRIILHPVPYNFLFAGSRHFSHSRSLAQDFAVLKALYVQMFGLERKGVGFNRRPGKEDMYNIRIGYDTWWFVIPTSNLCV